MEEIVFKSDDLIVMGLINYFIAEKDYNPMIVHGADNEIWLENLSEEYKIIRIVCINGILKNINYIFKLCDHW